MNPSLIEDIVTWRMGSAQGQPLLDWRDGRLNFDSAPALDTARCAAVKMDETGLFLCTPPERPDYNPLRHRRVVQPAEDMFRAWNGAPKPLTAIIAMQDALLFPPVQYLGPPGEERCVQLTHCRPADPQWRRPNESILWPLSYTVRTWRVNADFVPTPWHKRRAELLWRGQTTGLSYELAEAARPLLAGIRKLRRWLHDFLTIDVVQDADSFANWASTYQRLVAVKMCLDIPDTDVRFVPMYDGSRNSMAVVERFLGKDSVSERIDSFWATQQGVKYALCLPGNDVPSGLRSDLLSGCLVLMPRPFWENAWFYGLKPDEHYIPLRADLSDLAEKLAWCRDNDALCGEIAASGRAFARTFYAPALEFEIQSRMVERLARQTLPPATR